MTPVVSAETLVHLRASLLNFYRATRRDLPWRRSRDPYAIWVSEIMLQQTQVDTVVPRYEKFLAQFPTVTALAQATEHSVCEAWAGLGYYRRARHLYAAAQELVRTHQSALPADVKVLQTLPGIGRYTAGAIASIAYGLPAPLVDGNVVRVLSRLFCLSDLFESSPGKTIFWDLAAALAIGESPGDLNQALMELGAITCTVHAPRCQTCPVQTFCGAHATQTVSRYPTPSPKVARRKLAIAFAWLEGPDGVWLERRGLDGLWAGLWELPSAAGTGAKAALAQRLGHPLGAPWVRVTHELTHRQVTATVYRVKRLPPRQADDTLRPYTKPLGAPLSALARKAILATQAVQAAAAVTT